MTSSRFATQTLAPPPAVQPYIAPGKYIAIDEDRFAAKQREPEKDIQLTNWMMLVKKLKSSTKFLFQALTSFLTSFLIFVGTEHTCF